MTTEDFEREAAQLRPMLVQVAARTLGDARYAEDAAQDALAKLWDMHTELHLPMGALARAVVKNLCIDHIRRRRTTFTAQCPERGETAEPNMDEDPFTRVMRIADTLPAAQQVVLRLRHIDGMDTADIARLTGASEASVRKQLSRARMAIRERILKHDNDE